MEIIIKHKQYYGERLSKDDLSDRPEEVFEDWYKKAHIAQAAQINAMYVATASSDGMPNVRTVLLRGFDQRGFVFMSNYLSAKGREIAKNPKGAILFYWIELNRQVRAQGTFEQLNYKENNDYFQTRPRGSQIAALVSSQSAPAASREELEVNYAAKEVEFEGKSIPCPENWGGYRLVPQLYEFWSGQENRLHDRIQYTLQGGIWKKTRLEP